MTHKLKKCLQHISGEFCDQILLTRVESFKVQSHDKDTIHCVLAINTF